MQGKLLPYREFARVKDYFKTRSFGRFFGGSVKKTFIKEPQITFMGATQTVTGSKYYVEYKDKKIFIDNGLFQGLREDRDKNRNKLPIFPRNIDAVILTHAHLDHSGYLPLLVKEGFCGKIYCTEATYELCKVILMDSGFLQEEEFKFAKKHELLGCYDAEPLYTQQDALECLKRFKTIKYDEKIKLDDDISFEINNAGHILGAGVISLYLGGRKIVFSGDLGRKNDDILFDPTKIKTADYILCETTYGNRVHKNIDAKEELGKIINMTMSKGGSIIIPAFAVGRCQLILYYIYQLRREGKIPFIPVFVDSPMSIKVTHLLDDFAKEHKLTTKEYMEIYEETRFTTTVEQSKRIFDYMKPKIIISASGMASGGRVLHHIAHYAPYQENTIVLVGYQSIGTRGRQLQEGERELKIHGEDVEVNCDVVMLENMSAHADSNELMDWLSSFRQKPKKLFLVHGEKSSMEAFQERVENELNWDVETPEYLQIRQLI